MSQFKSLLPPLMLTVALIVAGGAQPPGPISASAEPVLISQPAPTGNIDLLGIWISAARDTFSRVRDYQCTLSKRERIDGTLQDEQVAIMKVRSQPFSVHVKFTSPRLIAGKEASYVTGRNNGMMKARSGGALALVGYVTLDPRDPKALRGTRHSITEAGIGNLIDQLAAAHSQEKKRDVQVTVAEVKVGGCQCVRFEVNDAGADGVGQQARTLIYFDKEINLPIRYEAYKRSGELVECFSYTDLRFNVGLTDAAFP